MGYCGVDKGGAANQIESCNLGGTLANLQYHTAQVVYSSWKHTMIIEDDV